MLEKWERQPFRVGMVLGFVALPLLWLVQDNALRLLTPAYPYPMAFYFEWGALPGAALGAGLSQAIAAYRKGNMSFCRWHLLGNGGVIGALTLALSYWVFSHDQRPYFKIWFLSVQISPPFDFLLHSLFYQDFVLHCALLMFFAGIFVRSRR